MYRLSVQEIKLILKMLLTKNIEMALTIDFITTNEYSNTVIIPINKELEEKMTISKENTEPML